METGTASTTPVTAMNQTVSVVEPPASWFDPGLIFVYAVITALLAGGAYWAYQIFSPPPPKKRAPRKVKAVVPAEKGNDYPNVKAYDEDFIPKEHLKNRASKLKKEGGTTSGGEMTSGDEMTSGGELSGGEGKGRKRKTKRA